MLQVDLSKLHIPDYYFLFETFMQREGLETEILKKLQPGVIRKYFLMLWYTLIVMNSLHRGEIN